MLCNRGDTLSVTARRAPNEGALPANLLIQLPKLSHNFSNVLTNRKLECFPGIDCNNNTICQKSYYLI